jgi:hypothetical protein
MERICVPVPLLYSYMLNRHVQCRLCAAQRRVRNTDCETEAPNDWLDYRMTGEKLRTDLNTSARSSECAKPIRRNRSPREARSAMFRCQAVVAVASRRIGCEPVVLHNDFNRLIVNSRASIGGVVVGASASQSSCHWFELRRRRLNSQTDRC